MKVLITGGAGFIGSALGHKLLDQGNQVYAIDNLNDYYEVSLKQARLERLSIRNGFEFKEMDIVNRSDMESLFSSHSFDIVMHLAAQAGVRYSIENPAAYIDSNLVGFGNILEGCRHSKVAHLVYASSSSVYGGNTKTPFSESDPVNHPVSLYAATKRANEMMAHSYAHLYQLPCTGLRFFTVYGPWGRPDMAFFKFTKMILAGEPIPVFNNGNLSRDFTYIDDIVQGILQVFKNTPKADPNFNSDLPDPGTSSAPFRVLNIGNGQQVQLLDYIKALENALGVKAEYNFLPMQPGDVYTTYADTQSLADITGYKAGTRVEEGLKKFADWYREYYNVL